MNAIYYSSLPFSYSARKAKDPDRVTVMGTSVYVSEVFPALLKYGSFDHIYLPEFAPALKSEVLAMPGIAAHSNRISFLPDNLLYKLREPDRLVLMSPGSYIRSLARLRDKINRLDSPITGAVHSLNYDTFYTFYESMLLDMLAPLENHDAIFVSSTAGMRVLQNQIACVSRKHQRIHQADLEFRPRLVHVPLGVDADLYRRETAESRHNKRVEYNLDADAIVILYFGRLSDISKADLIPLILAFSSLPYREKNIHLIISGDDTQLRMTDTMLSFAAQVGCGTHVRVITNVLNQIKETLFAIADIFVSPSDCIQESFGITLIEAMAASLPVVASDWNGYKDIVVDGETGFLVPTFLPEYGSDFDQLQVLGDMLSEDLLARTTAVSIPHLHGALLSLALNGNLRETLGQAGRERVMKVYNWPTIIRRYEVSWNELHNQARANSVSTHSRKSSRADECSYKEVFGHYATSYLTASSKLKISSLGNVAMHDERLLGFVAVPKDRINPELLVQLLQKVRDNPGTPVNTLIAGAHRPMEYMVVHPVSPETIMLIHVARLVKYGLLLIE